MMSSGGSHLRCACVLNEQTIERMIERGIKDLLKRFHADSRGGNWFKLHVRTTVTYLYFTWVFTCYAAVDCCLFFCCTFVTSVYLRSVCRPVGCLCVLNVRLWSLSELWGLLGVPCVSGKCQSTQHCCCLYIDTHTHTHTHTHTECVSSYDQYVHKKPFLWPSLFFFSSLCVVFRSILLWSY